MVKRCTFCGKPAISPGCVIRGGTQAHQDCLWRAAKNNRTEYAVKVTGLGDGVMFRLPQPVYDKIGRPAYVRWDLADGVKMSLLYDTGQPDITKTLIEGEAPEALEAPEIPKVPEVPEDPEIPEAPEAPEASDAPEASEPEAKRCPCGTLLEDGECPKMVYDYREKAWVHV